MKWYDIALSILCPISIFAVMFAAIDCFVSYIHVRFNIKNRKDD